MSLCTAQTSVMNIVNVDGKCMHFSVELSIDIVRIDEDAVLII